MFKKVEVGKKLPEMEKEVLEFWKENKIFEKSLEKNKDNPAYTFYDGPPFATGTPHYGHIVGSVMKDVVPRYWTMRGKYVERKWGWDCHGLPIENIVEKELGSKKKKDIEEMGVEKFNGLCRSKVLGYVDEWKKVITRLGRWADMENAYKTMDLPYMESVWNVFKQLYDKGLIYEGYRSMHICTRCETTLSQQEVSEGYKDIKDLSAIAKFELVDEPGTFVLAWTTTPWTLIGNVALAVGKNVKYTKVRVYADKRNEKGKPIYENIIVAKDIYEKWKTEFYKDGVNQIGVKLFGLKDFSSVKGEPMVINENEIIDEMEGNALVGKKYKPLFDYYQNKGLQNEENGWKIYAADFVTTEEGTGVVHIAPAFGEDDLKLGQKEKLPFVQHVGLDGVIKKEAGDTEAQQAGYRASFAGLSVKPMTGEKDSHQKTDIEIIKYLAHNNLLFSKEKYEHSYPHCWRCDTPLINYATSSWFVAVEKVKEEALEMAKEINWTPKHMKEGRFGNWLEGARDWSISRQRFWASVMPIWVCDQCGEVRVFGSVGELEEISGEKITDIHKHIVDKITFKCEKCASTGSAQAGTMKRVPDVLDTWFDSGSMPYAQMHYPFENQEKFEANFPADFIAEGQDQTRAWFYYLHILGTALKNKPAFKNVIVNGTVLAEDGKKMSKRLSNYPDPMVMFEKYGADAVRFYLMSSPVVASENLNFKEADVADVVRGMMRMLWNSYSFFVLYANIDGWKAKSEKRKAKNTNNLLDRWIVSELHMLIRDFNLHMENYELNRACRLVPKFVDNLSNWYVRRSRKRFWKSENDNDKNEAYATLYYVLVELSKVMAPFAPFISEEIFKNLTGKESVHLEEMPMADEKLIDERLNEEMQKTREIITEALQLRAKNGIKVRQPLGQFSIFNFQFSNNEKEFLNIIKEEVNVKNVAISGEEETEGKWAVGDAGGVKVFLNTEITQELRMEGQAREVVRFIQEMRKEAGYEVDNRIQVCYDGKLELFDNFGELIAKEVLADRFSKEKLEKTDLEKDFDLDGEKVRIGICR
ncbi:MAG: isoleucine--tRNA ligase [Candidatus Moranbacteria bacterium]|jgi:isoleucyl-tRNA synthetase|nr:isoleucine--tRNA ligase [Candidatus Moranbacteria bacterium]